MLQSPTAKCSIVVSMASLMLEHKKSAQSSSDPGLVSASASCHYIDVTLAECSPDTLP